VTILEELPARIDDLTLQISQLREEMRGEFAAVRGEMDSGFAAVRAEMHAGDEEARRALREEIRAGDEETRRVLRDQIRAGDAEIMGQARMLHEDLMSRLALMQEGNPRRGNADGKKR
jgi:hypothetical protein